MAEWTEAERAVFRKAGAQGGHARAKKLSAARRKEIAKIASAAGHAARWGKPLPKKANSEATAA